jgi:LCP family protein required for cell wall assembly
MHEFRKKNRDDRRQSLDGFTSGAPGHPPRRPVQLGSLNSTTGRRLDDFSRSEGYHLVDSSTVGPPPKDGGKEKQSLLHMTLPNDGVLAGKKSKKDSKNKPSRWKTIRKWSLRSALALTVLALVLGGFLVFKGIIKLNKVFKGGGEAAALQEDVKPELLKGEGDGRVNILLMGKGGPGHEGADLTDTMIVASVDPVNKNATLVSIPRDLWVSASGQGSSKINAVYANAKNRALKADPKDKAKADQAGAEAAKQIVSQVLGIPVHYYGTIDFEGFKQAVDTVGGVDINVPADLAVSERLWDSTTGRHYNLNVPAGQQHFDSTKALYFARSRHTSARGDFDRAERQRLFIQALAQKVMSAGTYTNPVKISQLMSAFGDHLATDMSINNALRLAEIGRGIDLSKLKSIGLADPPNNFVRTDNINGLSVVRPTAGVGDYSQIQNYIRNTLRDPYLAKENASVAVLNGTGTAGLATQTADQLKSYGYNVVTVGDAPTHDYAKTILVDLTGKKPFTKNYLEKRFDVKATSKLPDSNIQAGNADFVIILGSSQ